MLLLLSFLPHKLPKQTVSREKLGIALIYEKAASKILMLR